MHRSFFVENKYDYDMITGFLPVAKVSKGQQKSVISIGQQKSQQKSVISSQGQQFFTTITERHIT